MQRGGCYGYERIKNLMCMGFSMNVLHVMIEDTCTWTQQNMIDTRHTYLERHGIELMA